MDKGLRILILEDNQRDARLAQFELEEAQIPFTARVVATEGDFIHELHTFLPDIVLSDYDLPQYSGTMALAEVKRFAPEVPFILVTGAISEERAIEMLTSGARDYVMKTRLNRLAPAVLRSLAEAEERKARLLAEQTLRRTHGDLEAKVDERTVELQKEIEERRRAEEKYRNVFDNALDGISLSTLDGRYISVNPAFSEIFGYDSPEDLISSVRDLTQDTFVQAGQRAEYLQALQGKGFIKNYEMERFRKDGSRIWISTTSRAVKDKQGNIVHIESFTKDITELKALEKQLFEAQKMEAMGTLAGGIAHDFNNILGSIIGFTELAAEQPDESARRHCIEQVLKACDRAKNLVRQILAFSRRTENEKQPIDLRLIGKEVLKLLSSAVPTTIEIRPNITSQICTINADPTQMHQILMNLCTNAVQAMGEQGGVLEVSLSRQIIEEGMAINLPDLKPGPYIRLTVADTGNGIDPTIMDRIFDPFFTTKKIGEGTGLGLAVVYGIVKSHDGAIAVTSEPDHGTTFVIYIPAVEEAPVRQGTETSDEPVPRGRGRERILFVDDEKALTELGKRMLSSLGYDVTIYTDSREALNILQQDAGSFDLVITDMTMPHMTGKELARGILELRPDMPIIICTGHSEYIDVNKALELGIKALIMKPISRKELARAVREVLDEARRTEPERSEA